MSKLEENEEKFKWGVKINNNDSDLIAYKCFTYRDVQYNLYDSVYLYREGAKETDIGKLVKIWWSKKGGKRGKVLWFFRPADIYHYLNDYEPSWNELFLASGEGKGAFNIIPLEAIVGKCNVVCTSKDRRNPLPSKPDLRKANYYFSHIFDIGKLRITDTFPDSIGMIKVDRLFNWNQEKPKATVTGPSIGAQVRVNPKVEVPSTSSTSEYIEHPTSTVQTLKKRKILVASEGPPISSSQDARKWFSKLPWDERVKEARDHGTLVHLVNLDPSFTSSDVEGMISSGFKLKVDAKIIPPLFGLSYGQALVIFQSNNDSDFVITELKRKCLIVEGRPLIARKSSLIDPGIACTFPGHLIMDKSSKIKTDKRKAVSTSHCAQGNTIEHEMAFQWRVLQKRCELCWEALHEKQKEEVSPFLSLMTKSVPSDEQRAVEEVASTSVSPAEKSLSESDPALTECAVNT